MIMMIVVCHLFGIFFLEAAARVLIDLNKDLFSMA
jgi:hypothetical protein